MYVIYLEMCVYGVFHAVKNWSTSQAQKPRIIIYVRGLKKKYTNIQLVLIYEISVSYPQINCKQIDYNEHFPNKVKKK